MQEEITRRIQTVVLAFSKLKNILQNRDISLKKKKIESVRATSVDIYGYETCNTASTMEKKTKNSIEGNKRMIGITIEIGKLQE